MNKISKIFVIHYTKLEARKKFMLEQIHKWNLQNVYFYEHYDQEALNFLDIQENFDTISAITKNGPLKLPEMSLALKYKNILKTICNEEGKYFLILEDDVIFKEDPLLYINKTIDYLESNNINFDVLFMGEAGLRVNDDKDVLYRKDHPATNGLCTVLYTKKAVQQLYNDLMNNKISRPLDWEFNYTFEKLNFNVYWGKAITKHGSVFANYDPTMKQFKSSLR